MTSGPDEQPYGHGLRASHADRDEVVERLREAAGEGRLDIEELQERVEAALTARTYGELAPLTADLPAPGTAPGPVHAPVAGAGEPLVLRGGMHGQQRTGRWEVPARMEVRGGMGGVRLDFTRVRCALPEITIEVRGGTGGVRIVLPDGWAADTTGVDPGLGGLRDRTTPGREPGTPLVRLVGSAGAGGLRVRHPNVLERRRLRDNPAS